MALNAAQKTLIKLETKNLMPKIDLQLVFKNFLQLKSYESCLTKSAIFNLSLKNDFFSLFLLLH